MYAWIWRRIPGPTPARLLISAAMLLVAVAILWQWLFPWMYTHVPLDSVGFAG
jgi:hypothetical protein